MVELGGGRKNKGFLLFIIYLFFFGGGCFYFLNKDVECHNFGASRFLESLGQLELLILRPSTLRPFTCSRGKTKNKMQNERSLLPWGKEPQVS